MIHIILRSFSIGDKVWQYRAKLDARKGGKLEPQWHRPYWIHEAFGNRTYKLKTLDRKVLVQSVHGNRVTLRTNNQEVSDHVVIPERRTLAERIHDNMFTYIQDLDCGDPQEPILLFEILRKLG
ncbi:8910_t:CDS:2 [Gigaspora margarita]|uniref:8910_t:CDS:1 n=1 Tax=Gigaspora margarita TaxID=4874 RepID=A0ABN7UXU0_GIGMA|nr:8910_t:CDS:2 [Gigaspora margarita]